MLNALPGRMVVIAVILLCMPVVIGLYAYAIYPAILRWMGRRDNKAEDPRSAIPPTVTIVIPAYNEEQQIRGAIEAVLAQDYPADRRHLLVLSDASTDRTDAIVAEYAARGVELLRMPIRGGKTAAENASLPRIRGEIVINTDASVRLHPSAVRLLVEAMSDPIVGVASTRDVSVGIVGNTNHAEAGYVGYEMRVRDLETRAGGIVGASGSGYAIRAELHRVRLRDDLSRDFSAALVAHRHGMRAVSVNDAVCFVPRSTLPRHEYRRKVRTISRGMETLYFHRDLMNPFVHGTFAWKLLSHKICRWLVSLSALPAFIGVLLLTIRVPSAGVLLVVALGGAALAVAGAVWPDGRALPRWLPARLLGALSANLAVVHSAWRFIHGHEDHVWEPTRRPAIQT